MALPAATRLGPYEIVALIGAGGMGEVYKARDTRLERTVAIKVLPATVARDPDARARFEREARAVAALDHPHICAVYDIGRDGAIDFIVMQYLEGETLASRLQKGPPPLEQVIRYTIEIADALDKAHRHGVVHRDLKPANIMLTKTGARLLDFGLARLQPAGGAIAGMSAGATEAPSLTVAGTILGTLQYVNCAAAERFTRHCALAGWPVSRLQRPRFWRHASVRPAGQWLQSIAIAGTDGVASPFFSPDGRWIGFFQGGDSDLKKIALTGGAPQAICDVDGPVDAIASHDFQRYTSLRSPTFTIVTISSVFKIW